MGFPSSPSANTLLVLVVVLASSAYTGRCRHYSGTTVTKMLPCMESLMRCQNFFDAPVPPDVCCEPLKYVLDRNMECICAIVFNEAMLGYLNLPYVNALTLPLRCNLSEPDLRICAAFDIPHITLDGVPEGQSTNPYRGSAEPPASDDYVDENGFIHSRKEELSNAGQSKDHVGVTKIWTFAIAMLLVSRTLFFAHVF